MNKPNLPKKAVLRVILMGLGAFLALVVLYGSLQIFRGKGIDFKAQVPTLNKKLDAQAEIDPEIGWKIYRNEEYGFGIRYPKDWYIYTVSPAEVYLQPDEEQPGNIPGPHASALTITVTPVPLGIPLLDAIETQKKEEGNAGIKFVSEEIEIGGTKGLKVKTTCEGVGCGAPEWFVIKGDHLYHFDSNLGYTSVFDQIISTFRY